MRFPAAESSRAACLELAPRRGDFAVVGVAARRALRHGGTLVEDVGLAAFGVAAAPVRLAEAEAQVRGAELTAGRRRTGGRGVSRGRRASRRPTSTRRATTGGGRSPSWSGGRCTASVSPLGG